MKQKVATGPGRLYQAPAGIQHPIGASHHFGLDLSAIGESPG
jgi:hypothetical protein